MFSTPPWVQSQATEEDMFKQYNRLKEGAEKRKSKRKDVPGAEEKEEKDQHPSEKLPALEKDPPLDEDADKGRPRKRPKQTKDSPSPLGKTLITSFFSS